MIPIRSMAMVAMTTRDGTWNPETLSIGPLYAGQNSALLVGDLGDAMQPLADGGFEIVGPQCITWLGRFGWVVLWHGPSEDTIRRIREASSVTYGTRVSVAVPYESVGVVPPWSPAFRSIWEICRAFRMQSTIMNTRGEYTIDYYESSPPDNKNHSMAVDIANPTLAPTWVEALDWVMQVRYKKHPPDDIFVDCLQERRFWGSATNVDRSDDYYQEGHRRMILGAQARLAPIVGHNPGRAYTDILTRRVDEFFWKKTVDQAIESCQLQISAGLTIGLGVDGRSPWAADPTRWERLVLSVQNMANHRMYATLARTGSAFQVFHPGKDLIETGG